MRPVVFINPLIDGDVKLIEPSSQHRAWRVWLRKYLSQARAQQAIVGSCAKQDRTPSLGGNSIAMRLWYARDNAMQTQTTQVVGHLSAGNELGLLSQQGSPVIAKFAVGKTPRQKMKHHSSVRPASAKVIWPRPIGYRAIKAGFLV